MLKTLKIEDSIYLHHHGLTMSMGERSEGGKRIHDYNIARDLLQNKKYQMNIKVCYVCVYDDDDGYIICCVW